MNRLPDFFASENSNVSFQIYTASLAELCQFFIAYQPVILPHISFNRKFF